MAIYCPIGEGELEHMLPIEFGVSWEVECAMDSAHVNSGEIERGIFGLWPQSWNNEGIIFCRRLLDEW